MIKQGAKLVETAQMCGELGVTTSLQRHRVSPRHAEHPILGALGHDPCAWTSGRPYGLAADRLLGELLPSSSPDI